MWRDHLGSPVEEAADDVDWIVRAVIAAAHKGVSDECAARGSTACCDVRMADAPRCRWQRRPASSSFSRRAYMSRMASW